MHSTPPTLHVNKDTDESKDVPHFIKFKFNHTVITFWSLISNLLW